MKVNKTVREGVKLAASGSVQMMLGGIVAAVMPPQVSVLYKVAAYLGGLVVAAYAGDKLDDFVEAKIDEIEEMVDDLKPVIKEAIEKHEAEETGA